MGANTDPKGIQFKEINMKHVNADKRTRDNLTLHEKWVVFMVIGFMILLSIYMMDKVIIIAPTTELQTHEQVQSHELEAILNGRD